MAYFREPLESATRHHSDTGTGGEVKGRWGGWLKEGRNKRLRRIRKRKRRKDKRRQRREWVGRSRQWGMKRGRGERRDKRRGGGLKGGSKKNMRRKIKKG